MKNGDEHMFDSIADAQAFTGWLAIEGWSFRTELVTYRKRLNLPMRVKVTVYSQQKEI